MKEFFKKIFSKESMKKFFYSFVWLMVLIFVADIVTKWSFVNYFGGHTPSEANQIQIIHNFLYINLSFNQGMAWSLLSGDTGQIVLACVSFVLGGGLIFYYVKYYSQMKTPVKIAIALMIAGAIGNLIDRSFYWKSITGNESGVIDWIQVYFGSVDHAHAFPTFNIADSALVIGVIILLVVVIIEAIQDARKNAKEGKFKYSPKELKEAEEAKNEENKDK